MEVNCTIKFLWFLFPKAIKNKRSMCGSFFFFKWNLKKFLKSHYPSRVLVTLEEFSAEFLFIILWFPGMLWSPDSCTLDTVGKLVRIIQIVLQMAFISKKAFFHNNLRNTYICSNHSNLVAILQHCFLLT